MDERETVWIGYRWTWPRGWVEVCSGASYADVWGELKDREPHLNSKLLVRRADEPPPPSPHTGPRR